MNRCVELKPFKSEFNFATQYENDQGNGWISVSNPELQICLNIEILCRTKKTATVKEMRAWQNVNCLQWLGDYYTQW